MAEMDDVLAELRHCIMGQLKPAQPQHQETPAMTQSVNVEYQRHGSAAIALRRLAHPGRNGGVVVGDDRYPSRSTLTEAAVPWGMIHPR